MVVFRPRLAPLLAAALVAGAGVCTPVRAAEPPNVVPALREWTSGEGAFELGPRSRIVVPVKDRRLLVPVAMTFATDLWTLTGRKLPVVSSRGARARRGDVRLALGTGDAQLGREGYRLQVGRRVLIAANRAGGAFYGTRTFLQLLRQDRAVPAGTARDWPRYPERGLMVDIGRKHFSLDWLRAHIRELSYLKLNQLHLHFSDNQGWRIESERHPEVVSRQHLTKDQVRSLVALAERYQVRIVPEIDMPGHMQAALAAHPELQLRDAFGQPMSSNLDYSKPEARRFARELVEEYASLFPGPYFHIGADEYLFIGPLPLFATPLDFAPYPQLEAYARERFGPNAGVKDGIRAFVNELDGVVHARGKRLRIWNDGIGGAGVVSVNPDVVIEWWRDSEGTDPDELIAHGHRVLNAGWFPTYYVNGPTSSVPPRPDLRESYEKWSVERFMGPLYVNADLSFPAEVVAREEPSNLGSELHVWNDDPNAATENEIAAGISPRLRIVSQKTWESRGPANYSAFESGGRAIGHAPGFDP